MITNKKSKMATMAAILIFCLILRHLAENNWKIFYKPKPQNNQKNMNNYVFLIILIQKIENLTANSIFPNYLV